MQDADGGSAGLELTLLMPCLNEAETIATCVAKARESLRELGVAGEVLVADNGSTDGSQALAEAAGARVVAVPEKGYGSALLGGIAAARGQFVIMGDADDSYDWSTLGPFVEQLRAGADLVMGCRLPRGGGTILPGAMPPLNRYLGNPFLSWLGRWLFGCPVTDFHCGLRGFRKSSVDGLNLHTTGMEFASEMVIRATLQELDIRQVPITLHPDGRTRPPHLRPWRDGWRHLRFMLLYSPRWLFLVPGFLLIIVGALGLGALAVAPVRLGSVRLSTNTQIVAALAVLVGCQAIWFWFSARLYAVTAGLLPRQAELDRLLARLTLERGLLVAGGLTLSGLALLAWVFGQWYRTGFGELPVTMSQAVIPAVTLIAVGVQAAFASFFFSILALPHR